MNKLKRFFTLFMSLALLVPTLITINSSDVYADTTNIALKGKTSVSQSDSNYSGNTAYSYSDFIDVTGFDSVTLTGTLSSGNLPYGTTSVTLYIVSQSGVSTKLGGIAHSNANWEARGSYSYTQEFTADLSAYKGLHKFQVCCACDGSESKSASVNSLVALSTNPVITGVLANGNSCVQNDGNLTHVKFRINIILF